MEIYRCALDLEIPADERRELAEAIEIELAGTTMEIDVPALATSARAGRIRLHYLREHPWEHFEPLIALFSVHLHELVRGVSTVESLDDDGTLQEVRAEKIIGRRGETVRLPLLPDARPDGVHVDPDREDLDAIRARWSALPRWVQDGLRRKYPPTRLW